MNAIDQIQVAFERHGIKPSGFHAMSDGDVIFEFITEESKRAVDVSPNGECVVIIRGEGGPRTTYIDFPTLNEDRICEFLKLGLATPAL